MLAGALPFEAQNTKKVFEKICAADFYCPEEMSVPSICRRYLVLLLYAVLSRICSSALLLMSCTHRSQTNN